MWSMPLFAPYFLRKYTKTSHTCLDDLIDDTVLRWNHLELATGLFPENDVFMFANAWEN